MPTNQIIAKRGDVLLELFREQVPAGTLLVSSQVLSLASPVFEAMFNGTFAEGQGLSPASPKKVALPDDNPDSMTLLAKITHMQTDNLPERASFNDLADFALICDKYHCAAAVRSWSKVQIAEKLSDPSAPSYEKLLFITYVLDLHVEFAQASLRIARDSACAIRYQHATHGVDLLPIAVVDQVRNTQNILLSKCRSQLSPQKYKDLISSSCTQSGTMLKIYLKGLAKAEIPMTTTISVAEFAKRASILERQSNDCTCTTHLDCAVVKSKDLMQEVARGLANVHDSINPPCLDCMRRDLSIAKGVVCRLGHGPSRTPVVPEATRAP